MRLSPLAKTLLSEAKGDAPNAASRASVWAGVSGSVGAVAGATSMASAAGGTGTKAMLFGTLLGGASTVGLALAFLRFGPAPASAPAETPAANAAPTHLSPSSTLDSSPRGDRRTSVGERSDAIASATATPDPLSRLGLAPALPATCRHFTRKAPPVVAVGDQLAHEASLIGEARSALGRGDAPSALRAIAAASALPSRQLVPEELAVEAQALRSLGRNAEAKSVAELLRTRYPESALAR